MQILYRPTHTIIALAEARVFARGGTTFSHFQ
jgi:hypothetical protein